MVVSDPSHCIDVSVLSLVAPLISSTKSSGSPCVMKAPLHAGSSQLKVAIAHSVSLLNPITDQQGHEYRILENKKGGGQVSVTVY